jgi:hypothetical protein
MNEENQPRVGYLKCTAEVAAEIDAALRHADPRRWRPTLSLEQVEELNRLRRETEYLLQRSPHMEGCKEAKRLRSFLRIFQLEIDRVARTLIASADIEKGGPEHEQTTQ